MRSSIERTSSMLARSARACAAASVLFVGACAVPQESGSQPQASEAEPAAVIEGLRLGDHGAEVRFVHDYLLNHGYFPNDVLAQAYPGWRPMLAEVPADPDDFDEVLEQGVRGFQGFQGLRVSGVVDADTMALLKTQRCGQPDNFASEDDKIKHTTISLGEGPCAVTTTSTTKTITFRIEETNSTFVAGFRSALNEWSRLSSMRFREVTSGGCLIFKRARPMTTADRQNPSDNPIAINKSTFNTSNNKTKLSELTLGTHMINGTPITFTSGTVSGNQTSLRLTLLHEIGHTFGLDHSAHLAANGLNRDLLDAPIMAAAIHGGDNSTLLTDDDVHSLHFKIGVTRYDTQITGRTSKSFDVSRGGDFWEIDNQSSASNGSPIRCNGTTVFGAGVHIAVDNSRAWHTNAFGEVFKNRFVGCGAVQWDAVPSDAPLGFIAANGNGNAGEVWALGRDVARGAQDRRIFRFNGSRFVEFGGFGTRIAVDGAGTAYHVNQNGEVWILNPARNGWNILFSSGFENVHAGKNTFVWLIGKGSHHPMVLDPVWKNASGAECSPPITPAGGGVGCGPVFRTFGFQLWSNMSDAVSDGDSKIYMREAFIPNDGGPEFNGGALITFR